MCGREHRLAFYTGGYGFVFLEQGLQAAGTPLPAISPVRTPTTDFHARSQGPVNPEGVDAPKNAAKTM